MSEDRYRAQHKKRLSHMPWLYPKLKPHQREWAQAWQREIQQELMALETVHIGEDCFISPDAVLFAEPGRDIVIGDGVHIAAHAFLHGPIQIGHHVSINAHCSLDGGSAGIEIGDHSRIAAHTMIYAFNHGTASARLVREQPVTSRGIIIGRDVWIGANAGITDGVTVGDGAIVGMGAVVTGAVPANTVVAGQPARPVKARGD
ncbi:MAG: acyltransferase [Alcanivoracaceae bacterium]